MTLEGRALRDGESDRIKEGPFVEQNLDKLRLEVEMGYYMSSSLLHAIMNTINKDTKELIFPDDSEIINQIGFLADKYKMLCGTDRSKVDSLLRTKRGFDELVAESKEMLNKVNSIYNMLGKAYYPDGISIEQTNGKSR